MRVRVNVDGCGPCGRELSSIRFVCFLLLFVLFDLIHSCVHGMSHVIRQCSELIELLQYFRSTTPHIGNIGHRLRRFVFSSSSFLGISQIVEQVVNKCDWVIRYSVLNLTDLSLCRRRNCYNQLDKYEYDQQVVSNCAKSRAAI